MLVIAVLIFGVLVAYTFIGFQTTTYKYAADFDFLTFKFRVMLGTIALGYFCTILSTFYTFFPVLGRFIDVFANTLSTTIMRNFVAFLSVIWMTFALAMLPFNHTVLNVEDGSVNDERSHDLMKLHQLVYGLPFYTLFMFFAINLFMFILAMCVRNSEVNEWISSESGWAEYPALKKLTSNWKNLRGTLGWHFYIDDPAAGNEEGNVSWFKW